MNALPHTAIARQDLRLCGPQQQFSVARAPSTVIPLLLSSSKTASSSLPAEMLPLSAAAVAGGMSAPQPPAIMLPAHMLPWQHQLYSCLALQQQLRAHYPAGVTAGGPLLAAAAAAWSAAYPYGKLLVDPRSSAVSRAAAASRDSESRDLPKPQHSYIGLIAMAILSSPERKLVLSDIYQYILDNYNYFRNRGTGWRNSIRHNLSLNDCFVKAGRSPNGKGHFWAIHPANEQDFSNGDFRRRKAQRRVRRHMGLSVEDDEDSMSPPPTTLPTLRAAMTDKMDDTKSSTLPDTLPDTVCTSSNFHRRPPHQYCSQPPQKLQQPRRQFDMASLLAPEVNLRSSHAASANIACCKETAKLGDKEAPFSFGSEHQQTSRELTASSPALSCSSFVSNNDGVIVSSSSPHVQQAPATCDDVADAEKAAGGSKADEKNDHNQWSSGFAGLHPDICHSHSPSLSDRALGVNFSMYRDLHHPLVRSTSDH